MESGDACNTKLALGLGFHESELPSCGRKKNQRAPLDQGDDPLPSLSLGFSEAAYRWASRVDTGNICRRRKTFICGKLSSFPCFLFPL